MSLPNFLGRLTQALEAAGVPTMICGSVASFYHGVPRTTQDVDLVVKLTGSDRQVRDAKGIIDVCRGDLDVEYLRKWAAELGLTSRLKALLEDRP